MVAQKNLLLGAHVSIAGGTDKAISRGEDLGCTVIQIFTKNATRWNAAPLTSEEIEAFKTERSRSGIMVVAHDSYLINLAAPDRSLLEKSIDAFRDEMERAEQLEIPYLIMHPGSHTGSGEDSGLRSVASALDRLLKDTSGFRVSILLENTAGQGTALGHKFEHLARLMAEVSDPERMGVCLDTCHAFAAGYDLHDNDGYESVLHELDLEVGLDKLKAIHLNDAKKGLGSRVDRHEHIGRGMLGLECFRLIMTDQRLDTVPKFIETPKQLNGKDMDPVNLGVLRGLVRDASGES